MGFFMAWEQQGAGQEEAAAIEFPQVEGDAFTSAHERAIDDQFLWRTKRSGERLELETSAI
jgi:hypothetical protein